MNQLSLLPTEPPNDGLADLSRSPPTHGVNTATAKASDSTKALLGALEETLTPLPEAL